MIKYYDDEDTLKIYKIWVDQTKINMDKNMLGDDPFTWSFHLCVVRIRFFSFLVYYKSFVFP